MQKTVHLLFFLFLIQFSNAQSLQLAADSEISVLTVGPGESLNDAFGHSAFRIKDRKKGIDVVYGYGEYDFGAPNFYLKFAQGKLNYLISKTDFVQFYYHYSNNDRSIREQVLSLSLSEKQKLYDFLIENYRPKNRRYLYEFFFDNCATKIKDVTNIALNNSIHFSKPEDFKDASFRTLIHENLNKNSWGSLGIDLALGSVIDRQASTEDHMFLPKNIYKFFAVATKDSNGTSLVKQSQVLYLKKKNNKPSSFLTSPLSILGLIGLFILFITFKDYKEKKQSKWLDITLFSFTGLIGIMILLLWFATDHKGTHQNYNLLWAFALNILVIGQFFKKAVSSWFVKYIKLLIILLCLLTLHWIIGVQAFAIGFIPLLIALFVRYVFLVKHYTSTI